MLLDRTVMARNKGLSFYRRKKKISSALVREIFSWMFGIAATVFIAFVAVYFLGMTTQIVGASMEPTLYNGQQIFINRFEYLVSSPKPGDVIVFLPIGNEKSHYYVKRVVAGPGDSVVISGGTLYVNGEASEWIEGKILDPGIAGNECVLENGEYFCIGDNYNSSEDSRSANIGPVAAKDIVGRAWFHLQSRSTGIGFIK